MRFAALLLLCGCADSIALDDYRPAIWQATCDWYVRCGALTADDCALQLYLTTSDSPAAVRAGLVSYDGEAAAACVAAYADLPCDVTEPYPDFSACSDVYRGHNAIGEPCITGIECESGTCFYSEGWCGEACCMGTCDLERPQQIAALDEPCNDDVPCAHGLYCVGRYDPTQPQTCVPLPKRGEPCATLCAELGDNCDSTTKLCEDSSVRGEGCMDDSDCTDYYSCDPDNRCQTGFWQLLADGSACQLDGTDPECRSGWCDDNGLCGPRPACY
jgi:hypothetical protein